MIKDKLAASTGKAIILKDLSIIRLSMNAGNTRNDLCEVVKKLTQTYGELIGIEADEVLA